MEIKRENGKVITKMSLAEAFLDNDLFKNMSEDQKNEASLEIHNCLNEIISYQPERSKREDDIMYLKCKCGEYKHVFLDEIHMSRCGALNSMET